MIVLPKVEYIRQHIVEIKNYLPWGQKIWILTSIFIETENSLCICNYFICMQLGFSVAYFWEELHCIKSETYN